MYVHKIKAEAAAAEHLLRRLQATIDTDDEETRQIVAVTETDLVDAINAAIERRAELGEMHTALKARIGDMEARLFRMAKSIKDIDHALQMALETVGVQRIEAAEATVYLQANPPSVVVIDESKIPPEYMRHHVPDPDKKAIKAALSEGKQVPGCELSNRMMSVRVKTK